MANSQHPRRFYIDRTNDQAVVRTVGVRTSPASPPSVPTPPTSQASETEARAATHQLPVVRWVSTARRRAHRTRH